MTATDELRRLLDERGVEYEVTAWSCGAAVWWRDSSGAMWRAHDNEIDELLSLYVLNSLTPEQAIDATLGRGTCHAVFEVDAMSEDDRIGEFVCSECGETFGDVRDQRPNYCPACGRKVVE